MVFPCFFGFSVSKRLDPDPFHLAAALGATSFFGGEIMATAMSNFDAKTALQRLRPVCPSRILETRRPLLVGEPNCAP
jgi:hypothetical protein